MEGGRKESFVLSDGKMTDEAVVLQMARAQARKLEDIISRLNERYAEYPEYANELSSTYVQRLLEVRAQIDRIVGISSLPNSDAVLHIRTREDTAVGPRASLLLDSISTFKTALTRVTAVLHGETRVGPGRLPEELRKVADFRVVGIAPGSVKIGISFEPKVHQSVLAGYPEGTSIEQDFWNAIQIIWRTCDFLDSDAPNQVLETAIPDPRLRSVVVREASRLSPSARGRVTSLSLESGPALALAPVVLTPRTRARALRLLYPGSKVEDFDDSGVLRVVEVDRDKSKHYFVLRNRPEDRPEVEGDFDESLRFAVMDAVDKARRVRVRGVMEFRPARAGRPILHIESLEVL